MKCRTLAARRNRIADAAGGVTDDAWANAAKHYHDDQLVALVAVIARDDLLAPAAPSRRRHLEVVR